MKVFFHKMLSIAISTLLLFTTMSFNIDMHYCGASLVDFSLINKAENCGMEKQQTKSSCSSEFSKKSCCLDKQMVFEAQEEILQPSLNLTTEQLTFVAAFVYAYTSLFEEVDQKTTVYKDYVPPFLIRDVQKLHETYLI